MEAENSPEATAARTAREKVAGEIIKECKKIRSEKKLIELLGKLDRGELPKNWRARLRKVRSRG